MRGRAVRAGLCVKASAPACMRMCRSERARHGASTRHRRGANATRYLLSHSTPLSCTRPHTPGGGEGRLFFKHPRLMASRLPLSFLSLSPLLVGVLTHQASCAHMCPCGHCPCGRPSAWLILAHLLFWSHRSATSCAHMRTCGKRGRGSRRRGAAAHD